MKNTEQFKPVEQWAAEAQQLFFSRMLAEATGVFNEAKLIASLVLAEAANSNPLAMDLLRKHNFDYTEAAIEILKSIE